MGGSVLERPLAGFDFVEDPNADVMWEARSKEDIEKSQASAILDAPPSNPYIRGGAAASTDRRKGIEPMIKLRAAAAWIRWALWEQEPKFFLFL